MKIIATVDHCGEDNTPETKYFPGGTRINEVLGWAVDRSNATVRDVRVNLRLTADQPTGGKG